MITEIWFFNEFEDRETGKKRKQVYKITSDQYRFLKGKMPWGDVYRYLNSVTFPEDVEE